MKRGQGLVCLGELELELNQAWRSRILPCQLDLFLHLVSVVKRPYGLQICKEGTYGTMCGPVHLHKGGGLADG